MKLLHVAIAIFLCLGLFVPSTYSQNVVSGQVLDLQQAEIKKARFIPPGYYYAAILSPTTNM